MLLFFRDLIFGDHRCLGDSIYTPWGRGPRGLDLIVLVLRCLFLLDLFKSSTIFSLRLPGFPQGSPGSLGVRRNPANSRRAPKAPLGTPCDVTTVLVCCFYPGASQVSRGSQGFAESFLKKLVVHRIALRGSQGSCEPPRGTQRSALSSINPLLVLKRCGGETWQSTRDCER